MRSLKGKNVIVMGAGSIAAGWSNGKACAVTYARAGANVACVDFVAARAEEAAYTIISEGGRAIALKADPAKRMTLPA